MLFHSYEFLFIFLPVVFGGYFLLGRFRPSWAITFLFAASLVFYGWWSPAYVPLLLLSIGCNLLLGGSLVRASGNKRGRRLALGVVFNLGLLGFFKYADFALANLNGLFGTSLPQPELTLPLGISFFTFTQIAFLIDVSRGYDARYGLTHYGLFVTFFPHLIAGPILHHRQMMPQFEKKGALRPSAENCAIGATIFAIGLFKKVVLADSLAPCNNLLFDAAEAGTSLTFLEAWAGAAGYALQLYFDFSGYCEMAIGLARLFGIAFPLNFFSPYRATSIIDFWRRWHMTLSQFLRDYLYFPLGGNRKGAARRYANIMITMLLGGLWHGAGWTFVAWGGLHGALLCQNHLWRDVCSRLNWRPERFVVWKLACWAMTFGAVTAAWVLFRSKTLDGAAAMLRAMAGLNGLSLPSALKAALPDAPGWMRFDGAFHHGFADLQFLAMVGGLTVFVATATNTFEFMRRFETVLNAPLAATADREASGRLAWRPSAGYATLAALATFISLLLIGRPSEFLYFQF